MSPRDYPCVLTESHTVCAKHIAHACTLLPCKTVGECALDWYIALGIINVANTLAFTVGSSSTPRCVEVRTVFTAVASAAAVLLVRLLLDEISRQESSWGVLYTATVAFRGVLPATLDSVFIAAVAVELEDKRSDLLSRRNQRRLLLALSTLAHRRSLQPCVLLDRTTLSVALELAKWRLPSPRHSLSTAMHSATGHKSD